MGSKTDAGEEPIGGLQASVNVEQSEKASWQKRMDRSLGRVEEDVSVTMGTEGESIKEERTVGIVCWGEGSL